MQSKDLKKRYSFWTIKKIFLNDYDLSLVPVLAYKGSRYSAKKYNLVRSDGSIKLANVTLDALRMYLASENY